MDLCTPKPELLKLERRKGRPTGRPFLCVGTEGKPAPGNDLEPPAFAEQVIRIASLHCAIRTSSLAAQCQSTVAKRQIGFVPSLTSCQRRPGRPRKPLAWSERQSLVELSRDAPAFGGRVYGLVSGGRAGMRWLSRAMLPILPLEVPRSGASLGWG